MAAYVQEMRACGRDPKTLQWHQTELSALALSVEAVLSRGCVFPDHGIPADLIDRAVHRVVASHRSDANRRCGCGLRAFGARLLQLAGSPGLCVRNALSERRRTQSPAVFAPTIGGRDVCPPVACLSACSRARRAERRHDGAQPRHPLAFARHGTPGLRGVPFTPRGCGQRRHKLFVHTTIIDFLSPILYPFLYIGIVHRSLPGQMAHRGKLHENSWRKNDDFAFSRST